VGVQVRQATARTASPATAIGVSTCAVSESVNTRAAGRRHRADTDAHRRAAGHPGARADHVGDDATVVEALHAGASGFLLKDTRPKDLLAAVHAVGAGQARLDPAVTAAVLASVRRGSRPTADRRLERLTEREREVLVLLAQGLSNAEVGQALVVAPGTVKTHLASVLAKLEVRDRVQAVVAAYRSGLVP
jgi:DNA-binding CsgD family transcriptional regulator